MRGLDLAKSFLSGNVWDGRKKAGGGGVSLLSHHMVADGKTATGTKDGCVRHEDNADDLDAREQGERPVEESQKVSESRGRQHPAVREVAVIYKLSRREALHDAAFEVQLWRCLAGSLLLPLSESTLYFG